MQITQDAHQLDIKPVAKTKSPQIQRLSPHSSLALLPSSVHFSGDKRLKPVAVYFTEIGSGPKISH